MRQVKITVVHPHFGMLSYDFHISLDAAEITFLSEVFSSSAQT